MKPKDTGWLYNDTETDRVTQVRTCEYSTVSQTLGKPWRASNEGRQKAAYLSQLAQSVTLQIFNTGSWQHSSYTGYVPQAECLREDVTN